MHTTWIRKGGDHADKSQHVTVEEVTFYPAGGGFEQRCKAAAFLEQFEPVREQDITPLRPIAVQIEDGPRMEAWTDGRRWNGWECPRVTRESFENLLREDAWDDFSFEPDGTLRYRDMTCEEGEEGGVVVIAPSLQRVEGYAEKLLLYDLSDLGFIWSEAREGF
jgi:hypothetical protein